MPIFLGLVGSLVIGTSDFFARYVARRNHAATTAATGLIFATSAAVLAASFGPGGFLPTDYIFGCASGLASGGALALLYRGLAVSSVAVVSPIVAVMLGAVPMFWEVATGTSLTTGVLSGVFIALFGLMVTTFDPALGDRVKQGVILGFTSGLCFGIGLVFMAQTTVEGGLWPVVGQRSTACIILIGFCTARGLPRFVRGHLLRFSAAAGILGSIGVLCYTAGFQRGSVTAVAIAASLFPIPTAVLAATFDNDSLRWWQIVGIGIVVAGIGLIARG
ncbi:MAG: DMT family transporter [Actinomycetota bacterium]|nr:DMT family transporter [Actinomycetota bacterium]